MGTKFSEDVIPLSDLKVNPGKVLSHVTATHRLVLVTSRGRGAGGFSAGGQKKARAEVGYERQGLCLLCSICPA